MSLRRTPPDSILKALRHLESEFEEVQISLASDINAAGEYGQQWLLINSQSVWVLDPDYGERPIFHFPFDEIQGVRSAAAVGSGILQIRSGGVWYDLIRFTNRLKYDFDRVLRRLEQILRGERPA